MYEKYIDKFVSSREMRDYLKTVELAPGKLVDLIYYAPCALTDKLEALEELLVQAGCKNNEELTRYAGRCVRNIKDALALLDAEGIFSVEPGYYNDEIWQASVYFETICTTYGDVLDFVNQNTELAELKPSRLRWINVTKWVKDEHGKYKGICDYVMVCGKLWYCNLSHSFYEDYAEHMDFYSLSDVNLPVPFQPGALVEVDGFPYGPKMRMVLVEIGDNNDCCCLQGFSKNEEGKWSVGAVKHGMIGYRIFPQISPLYTIHTYEGKLSEEEKILLKVKSYIDGKEEKGRCFWDCICGKNDLTDERVEEILKSL